MVQEEKWKCNYCDRKFLKETDWEKYSKIKFTNAEMRYLKNDASEDCKNSDWYKHLIQLGNGLFLSCPKRTCFPCFDKGINHKFNNRSSWQSHIKICPQAGYIKSEVPKGRRKKIYTELDKLYQNKVKQVVEEIGDGKYYNLNVNITYSLPETKAISEILEEKEKKKEEKYAKIKKTKTINKNNKTFSDLNQQLDSEGLEMVITKPTSPSPEPEELDKFYKLEKKHLEPLGIYNPNSQWRKLQELLENLEDNEGLYFIYFDDSLYLEDQPFDEVTLEDLLDPVYTISNDRETFGLVDEGLNPNNL